MSDMYKRLRAVLPLATFHPPATENQITRVEGALETHFPQWLRELYLSCNGVSGHQYGEPYLSVLEEPDAVAGNDASLLGWNLFLRESCDSMRSFCEETGQIDEWEKTHARNYLIIGSTGATAQNWAIHPSRGTEVIWYDERSEGNYRVLGRDLVEVVLSYEREIEALAARPEK